MSKDTKMSPPSRSKGSIQKRKVSVAIKDMDQKLRLRGDHHQISSPPSDSWAWRKYGQKPIKGSPYPRGYYKCSSSKGCPARKQVERNKLDPNTLLVTYSCEHNHPSPDSRNNHHRDAAAATASITTSVSEEELSEEEEPKNLKPLDVIISQENKLITNSNDNNNNNNNNNNTSNNNDDGDGELGSLVNYAGELGLFSEFESKSYTMLECPVLADRNVATDDEMSMIFTTMIDEDDSLIYSDLGELPECATVFR